MTSHELARQLLALPDVQVVLIGKGLEEEGIEVTDYSSDDEPFIGLEF
jgi:hypothetical protein